MVNWRILAFGYALIASNVEAKPPSRAPLPIMTGVFNGAINEDGLLWFSGWTDGMSFFLPPNNSIDKSALFEALKKTSDTGKALTVTFDPTSGRFDPSNDRIAYRICTVATDVGHFSNPDGSCGEGDASALFGDRISPSLSLGVADSATGREGSIGRLDSALEDVDVNPKLRMIALRARGVAHVLSATRNRNEADTHWMAALRDVTAWAALAPDDPEAWLEAANILSELGAYDEAIRSYRAISERWPEERYRSAARIGAIYRIQQRYTEALAELDRLVMTNGPQSGMKFHYHRGWTLTLLGLYDEAIREFSEGLKTQPDYAWAHLRRACAYGAIGDIQNAAADQQVGVNELTGSLSIDTEPLETTKADLVHARVISGQLEALAAKGSAKPTKLACDGYSENEPKRARSKMLNEESIGAASPNRQ